jgi:amino acid transporter
VAAVPRWRFNPLVPFSAGDSWFGGLAGGLALAIWFFSGYSEVSTAAEEIENPRRTIPLVLLIVTPLVILSYVLPMLAGLASLEGWRSWESGQFVEIGTALGGPLLGNWMFLASVASFTVIFMSYLLWWSRLAWAFADDGFLPAWLVRLHPRLGTPDRVLVLYALVYAVLAAFPFEDLLIVDVCLFGAYDLLVLISVIKARESAPPKGEGFRIPGGYWGVRINAAVLAMTWLVALIATAMQNPLDALAGGAALAAGPLLYPFAKRFRRRTPAESSEAASR